VALLLDTNIIIWLSTNDRRLKTHVRERIESGESDLYISIISAWEHGQKRKLKPLELPRTFDDLVSRLPHIGLDLSFPVHTYAESLPLIHRDPFDRILIAQAIHHDLEFVTSDERIHQYPVRWFW
jgi:PIN domain nuclease of toxin-antitoxin system